MSHHLPKTSEIARPSREVDYAKGTSAAAAEPHKTSKAELEAMLESSPIGGTAAKTKEGMSVVDIIKLEHAAIKELFEEYKRADEGKVKEAKAFLLSNQLVQHSAKEQIVLYKVMREKLDQGNALMDRNEAEHAQATKDLAELDALTWGKNPAAFEMTMNKLMHELQQHMAEEESSLLPALQAKCTLQELVDIGKRFQSCVVTTRPHPSMPSEGFGTAVASLAMKPVDAIRDAVRWTEAEKEAASKEV